MTLKVDGTNGVLQAYDYQVLTTGFSYTFASGTQTLVINPAGTLASGTVTMPASPVDGMVITVVSTQQVTAVTVAANTGQTMVGGAAQLIPNQPLSFMYRLGNTTWYPYAGGAGRASALVLGTTVASTSGTSIDFTGIPSWARRITVMYAGLSTNTSGDFVIRLGTSGGIVSSGYLGSGMVTGAGAAAGAFTTGFGIYTAGQGAAYVGNGSMTICLLNPATYQWVASGTTGESDAARGSYTGGSVTLSGAVTQLRFTTVSGTDTFDAGTINIMYE